MGFNLKKSIFELLFENRKFEYGCAMLFFDFPEIEDIHSKIDPNDIYSDPNDSSFGLEKESHCTLLFGIHDEVKLFQVEDILQYYEFSECKAYDISIFEKDNYDVLKFNIKGEGLYEANEELRAELPYTNEYEYKPHLTIAYLNPGMGKKYVEMFKDLEFMLEPTNIIYSDSKEKQHII